MSRNTGQCPQNGSKGYSRVYPNAKVVMVGCKLNVLTNQDTLRQLSKKQLIPVTHEQGRCGPSRWGPTSCVQCHSLGPLGSVSGMSSTWPPWPPMAMATGSCSTLTHAWNSPMRAAQGRQDTQGLRQEL